MLQNLNITFAGFARRTKERLDETVAATKGAMEAAHGRQQACSGNIEAQVTRMGVYIAVLKGVKTDLADLRCARLRRPRQKHRMVFNQKPVPEFF